MANLLFVGLADAKQQARLLSLKAQWRMRFVDNIADVLPELHREPADALVVAIDADDKAGIELLGLVRDHWPVTVRLVVSASTSERTVVNVLPVTHQFISQPYDPAHLLDVVHRTCLVQSKIYCPGVMAALGALKSLPAVPKLYQALSQELASGSACAKKVASIIEQDVSMTLRLLQLVNSSFYGLPRRITTIREAVNYLGFEPIRSLAVSSQLFRAMSQICAPAGFSLEAVQQHSMRVASLAASLLEDKKEQAREACSVAMLHDVGRVAIAVCLPESYAATMDLSRRENLPLHVAEQQILNSTHAEIGAYLLSLWGLPRSLIEAVALHHQPAMLDARQMGLTGAIHIADALDHHLVGIPGDTQAGTFARLDKKYLADLGLSDQVPRWIAQYQQARAAA